MRLLKLTANKESFHPVAFNPKGLSIIVGKRAAPYHADDKKTYNGVGKSLIIQLIHFCLACNRIEEFENKIPDWEFTLEFEVDDETHSASRKTSNQTEIILDGQEYSLSKFRDALGDKIFSFEDSVSYLTFRSLISRFIRPKKDSYLSYDNFVTKEQGYAKLINNIYLLGLDVDRASKKLSLKEELDKADKLRKHIEGDEIFRTYFSGAKDVDISIADLEENIQCREDKLKNYEIAEDYEIIRTDADNISRELRKCKNQATAYTNAIDNISRSLAISPDIPKERVISLYEEAKVTLSETVVKKLEDLENFHKNLLENRAKRLVEERKSFEKQLEEIEGEIATLGKKENELLEYLNTHGALDEYTALNKQLTSLITELNRLNSYKDILQKYKNKVEEKKQEFAQENIATNTYLLEAKRTIQRNLDIFRSFSREFYEDKPGGITIVSNEGMNKLRFEIKAKIQDDASDGISEVKIFCFDCTLLKAKHNHKVNFIFHDSRILANMDTRQAAKTFKLAYKHSIDDNFQYIISVNENTLNAFKKEFSPKEYEAIVENNTILELTDESDKTKLLGIEVDMDYEED